MIICTGCGKKNEDENRFCEQCGKKLQSSRAPIIPRDLSERPLGFFEHAGVPRDVWLSIRRMLEAWGYIAALIGIFAACMYYRTWWPLYPAIAVIGLILWARKI